MVALIDILFWFSSLYILPFWLMMWFAPTHERTAALMRNEWVYLAPLAAAYTIAVLPNLLDIFIQLGSDMPTPDIVVGLFSEREVILIGWLHYLAFDLFVGRWTWQRLVATQKPIYISMPVLVLSMMVAPLGALLGLLVTREYNEDGADTTQRNGLNQWRSFLRLTPERRCKRGPPTRWSDIPKVFAWIFSIFRSSSRDDEVFHCNLVGFHVDLFFVDGQHF